jgi:hypothetical protein
MRTAKYLTALGALIMASIIIYGFIAADFFTEGSIISNLYWGKVTLIDIYISFFVFFGWVVYRETSYLKIGIMLILIIVTGSLAICLYTLNALIQSKGDWKQFWIGKRIDT